MQKENITLKVLNPKGEIQRVDEIQTVSGLGTLHGKKIGILNNTKTGGEELLDLVEDSLKQKVGDVKIQRWRVPFMLPSDTKNPRLKEIADYSDGVIALMGD